MLQIHNLRAGYGAINVLWDVSMSIDVGKLTAIVGPNGAGKTTLLRAVMGLIPVQQGQIQAFSHTQHKQSWRMPWQGMVMIPEGRMIFQDMSVAENLFLGAFVKHSRKRVKARTEQAYAMFPRLYERRKQAAGTLSGGEAQMLAIARGLMSDPKLLLIDEPSLGLAPVIVKEIFAVFKQLKEMGKTIVLVEQNTQQALAVADHAYLLQSGKVVHNCSADKINIDSINELYFGR